MESANNWLVSLIASEAFWGIVGVALGVLMGEGLRWYREVQSRKRSRAVLFDELGAIKSQIYQKKDVADKIIQALDGGGLLGGIGVPTIDCAYSKFFPDLYGHLSRKERNCIHLVYSRMHNTDKILNDFESEFRSAVTEGVIDNPRRAYAGRLSDCKENYQIVIKLIDSLLAGDPTDVYYMDDDIDPSQVRFK